MEKNIQRKPLQVELTKEDRKALAERYHFQESDHSELDMLYTVLYPLTEAEVCYRIWPELEKGKRAAICVVTLGAGVDALQEIYTQSEEMLNVYMLECIGSTMLEKAYKQVEQMLYEETGLHVSKYQFPGNETAIEQVRSILEEMSVHMEDMPVSCNEACMMQPKKSVVYIVGLEKEKVETCICDTCQKKDCAHRQGKKRIVDYLGLTCDNKKKAI